MKLNIKFIPSPYYSHDKLISVLHEKHDNFCILSLNCQRIHAKFDRLFILIEELRKYNFESSAIRVQETWLNKEADLSLYQISNYTCISQGKCCSQHGGLITYIHTMITNFIFISQLLNKKFGRDYLLKF